MSCPICKVEEAGIVGQATALCVACSRKRFYPDDERETFYRREVEKKIAVLTTDYKADYKPEFHDAMIEQLVRCEIMMTFFERLIATNRETETTADLLNKERSHWRNVADRLQITMPGIRGDKKVLKHDFGDDFKKYMKAMLDDNLGREIKDKEE